MKGSFSGATKAGGGPGRTRSEDIPQNKPRLCGPDGASCRGTRAPQGPPAKLRRGRPREGRGAIRASAKRQRGRPGGASRGKKARADPAPAAALESMDPEGLKCPRRLPPPPSWPHKNPRSVAELSGPRPVWKHLNTCFPGTPACDAASRDPSPALPGAQLGQWPHRPRRPRWADGQRGRCTRLTQIWRERR